MAFFCKKDLWEHLAASEKKILLYGMGNGADKILDVCQSKGITVSGCFASDGFARGHSFRGFSVCTWGEMKALYGAENVIVLLAFGTSREDVLENIQRISREAELYAPDVPAFGNTLFDRSFFEVHREELECAAALLSDEESKRIFWNVVGFKLTGDITLLADAESDREADLARFVRPKELTAAMDLGAYNGDTVRELLDRSGESLRRIYAMEPDARTYKKLTAYAASEDRAEVIALPRGAWSGRDVLSFDASGNRNASVGENRSDVLADRPIRVNEVEVDSPDNVLGGARVDYIKYDVEGSEREALLGSVQTVARWEPVLMVSLYHRSEDLYALPLLLKKLFPQYEGYYLRRRRGIPAWDLDLYVTRKPR